MRVSIRRVLALTGCAASLALLFGSTSSVIADHASQTKAMPAAVAELAPTQGNDVTGTVTFTLEGKGVHVVADITGLTPGEHGFHIHENGDCSAPDGSSAGGHYNPHDKPHGAPNDAASHAGDLGNILADADGKAHLDKTFSMASLTGKDSILGHAVIVHGGVDDFKSQPSGNAGPRVACGVIKKK